MSCIFLQIGHGPQRPDWLAEAAGFESLHFGIRSPAVDHGLGLCLAMRYGTTTFNRDALFDFSSPRATGRIPIRRCRSTAQTMTIIAKANTPRATGARAWNNAAPKP